MRAEVITIGTELLLGQIVDSNAAFIARRLADIGCDVYRKTTVGDNEARIAAAIQSALAKSNLVITSGGIGPTVDDKTRFAVALATGRKLVRDPDLLATIEHFFTSRGLAVGENNLLQADIPEDARPIPNPVGTAPGFMVESDQGLVVSLPGVPKEMYYLMDETVLPFIRRRFGLRTILKRRVLHTAGAGESQIDRMIADLETAENPTVGLSAHPGQVDVRLCAKADDDPTAQAMLDASEASIRARLGDMIYGIDDDTLETAVVKLLVEKQATLALVETNTGGSLAERLSAVENGLDQIQQGLVGSKGRLPTMLGIDTSGEGVPAVISVASLANRLRQKTGADIGLAVVGDCDPAMGFFAQTPGRTEIAIHSFNGGAHTRSVGMGGISPESRRRIGNQVLAVLRRYLIKLPG